MRKDCGVCNRKLNYDDKYLLRTTPEKIVCVDNTKMARR